MGCAFHTSCLPEAALAKAGFRAFAGSDASKQPPDVPDVLPHETVAGWVRKYMKQRPFRRTEDMAENEQRFRQTMTACAKHINANFDVESLCRSFPKRLQELEAAKGSRLRH